MNESSRNVCLIRHRDGHDRLMFEKTLTCLSRFPSSLFLSFVFFGTNFVETLKRITDKELNSPFISLPPSLSLEELRIH